MTITHITDGERAMHKQVEQLRIDNRMMRDALAALVQALDDTAAGMTVAQWHALESARHVLGELGASAGIVHRCALSAEIDMGANECAREIEIEQLRAELEKPAAEPVARVTGYYAGRCTVEPLNGAAVLPTGMALYAGPPAAEPVEPVAWRFQSTVGGWAYCDRREQINPYVLHGGYAVQPLYAAPLAPAGLMP